MVIWLRASAAAAVFIRIIRLLDDKQRTLLEAARGIGGRLSQNDAARLTRALVSR